MNDNERSEWIKEASQLTEDQQKHVTSIPATKTATQTFVWTLLYKLGNALCRSDNNIGEICDRLHTRISALEAREVKTLADSFRGPWLPGKYDRGALVSHRGSAWLCVTDGEGKPGESGTWRLVVQRGKDGKDAAA